MLLVDSHCHIHFDPLSKDIIGVLKRAKENNVGFLLCVSVNLDNYESIKQLAASHSQIFSSVGIHPTYSSISELKIENLLKLAKEKNVIAIGETGLDYSRSNGDVRLQRDRFELHIHAAKQTNKPLIIHTRSAADHTMEILKNLHASDTGGVIHCFSEDWSTAKKALDIGFYISFSGIVTFKNAESLRKVAKKVPEDRILVETDSPYLAPVPHRGKINEPSFIKYTAQVLSDLRGDSLDTFAQKTTKNFFTLFSSSLNSACFIKNEP